MKMKKIVTLLLIGLTIISGCGHTNNATTQETTDGAVTEENISDGTREKPYSVGNIENIKFWGYAIESYGYASVGIDNFIDDKIEIVCKLDEYGYSNPLTFNTETDIWYFENNSMIHVYPCDDPKTFSVSSYEEYRPEEKVIVPCGDEKNIIYKVDKSKRYVAIVYYTLKEDENGYTNGKYDFIDGKLYGHIIFYDLDKQ